MRVINSDSAVCQCVAIQRMLEYETRDVLFSYSMVSEVAYSKLMGSTE